MTKSPLINALSALGYIILVASFFVAAPFLVAQEHLILIPIFMLSLVVLSVLVMSTCFFYRPILMYVEGQKKEATALFAKTVLTFAVTTVLVLLVLIVVSRLVAA